MIGFPPVKTLTLTQPLILCWRFLLSTQPIQKKLKLKILRAFDIKIYIFLSGTDKEIEVIWIGGYYNTIPQ